MPARRAETERSRSRPARHSRATAASRPAPTGSSCARPTAPATSPETVREFTVAQVNPQVTPTPTPTDADAAARVPGDRRGAAGAAARCWSGARAATSSSSSTGRRASRWARRSTPRAVASGSPPRPSRARPAQRAEFYDGIFRITQTRHARRPQAGRGARALLAAQRQRGAASKPKTRKLWGSGKGKFRTTGSYSAATVRGTTWLVAGHVRGHAHAGDRGRRGRARQAAAKKTILVRKGKRYVARARR